MEDKIILIVAMLFEIASDSSVYSKRLEELSNKLIEKLSDEQREEIKRILE